MKTYLDLMRYVRDNGTLKTDRTGTGTLSVFGYQMRFDLQAGFPLVTTKKIHLKSVIHELLWFLAGDTNIRYLQKNGVKIWDDWADVNGDLGPIYGGQWRTWQDTKLVSKFFEKANLDTLIAAGYKQRATFMEEISRCGTTCLDEMVVMEKRIDQIADALALIKHNPDSRRIMVSAWNVADIPKMRLPPCHALFQFYVSDMTENERVNYMLSNKELTKKSDMALGKNMTRDGMIAQLDAIGVPRKKLSCQLYQRSADIFLGIPFNIASYALLTHMLAQQADMAVGDFIWTGGDCHLYTNHIEQVDLQLLREPHPLPKLQLNKAASIFDYKFEDFEIVGYDHHPSIKALVAV